MKSRRDKSDRFFADKPAKGPGFERSIDAVYTGSVGAHDPNTYVLVDVAGGEYTLRLSASQAVQLGERLIEIAKALPGSTPQCVDCGTWMTIQLRESGAGPGGIGLGPIVGHECPYCHATVTGGKFRKGNFGQDIE